MRKLNTKFDIEELVRHHKKDKEIKIDQKTFYELCTLAWDSFNKDQAIHGLQISTKKATRKLRNANALAAASGE